MSAPGLAWLAVAGLVILSAGCRPSPPPSRPTFRVALVSAPGAPLAAAAAVGLDRVGAELPATTILRANADENAQRQAVRELGGRGVDLVFCVGDGIADVVYSEAAASPETDFVVVGGLLRGDNLAGVVFRVREGCYLAGVLAAHASASPVPGALLSGRAGAWDDASIAGFLEGFHSSYPGVDAVRAQGAEAARELERAGVAVALAPSGLPAGDELESCRQAGVALVPVVPRRPDDLPAGTAAAVVVDVPEAMVRVAREVRDGRFRSGTYGFDLGSGVVDLLLNPSWPGTASPGLSDALDDARAGITAGIVEVEHLGIGTGS